MAFIIDKEELKPGLIIFRRTDVKHRNWYCRVKIPSDRRYKTISLETSNIIDARSKAFDHDADMRFRVRHDVPIFNKSSGQVADEYLDHLKTLAHAGEFSMDRWNKFEVYIRVHIVPFLGKNTDITQVGEKQWRAYPLWRKQDSGLATDDEVTQRNSGRKKQLKTPLQPAKDGTIRQELMAFRGIMNFAADKEYIRERQVPKGKLPADKSRREEFTPKEYRDLHTFARKWIKEADGEQNVWSRTMVYNFVLVMANTGMRTVEARGLRWRDIDVRKDRQGRRFVCLNVRGKSKFRELVAAQNVADYLERIKAISKATKPNDFVFSTRRGLQTWRLYNALLNDLLTKSSLLFSSSGSRRSAYCFRHTYATFRLMEGVDVYFLAKQMGTSVQMIEDYYGHITPAKNAERILLGIPGWEPMTGPGEEPAA